MNQKVVVKEEIVRKWVRNVLSNSNSKITEAGEDPSIKIGGISLRASGESPDSDDEELNLQTRKDRRMRPYRGKAERRPTVSSTKSKTGREPKDVSLKRITHHLGDDKVKIGDLTFMGSGSEEEKDLKRELGELQAKRAAGQNVNAQLKALIPRIKKLKADQEEFDNWTPKSGDEFTEEDDPANWLQKTVKRPTHLPVKGRPLEGASGVILDIKKSLDKLQLARAFPEFVIQMLTQATKDYKALIKDSMKIVRYAAREYANDLKEVMTSDEAQEAGLSPEDVNLTDQELSELSTDAGLATLIGSSEFNAWFSRWIKGTYKSSKDGVDFEHKGAPPKIAKQVQQGKIPMSRLQSAVNIASKLKTFDVMDDTPSSLDIAKELGLNTKSEWELTRIDAFLILFDQQFRYFVNGQGGGPDAKVHYWSWVRNHAEELGHKSQF